jgi:SAM-dependent methyltransferase
VSENHFGEDVAARYDAALGEWAEPETIAATLDFLAELAGGGLVLELGIGIGRIALPLSARGVRVAGVDLSEPMLARLRAKPGGNEITIAVGDFATTRSTVHSRSSTSSSTRS